MALRSVPLALLLLTASCVKLPVDSGTTSFGPDEEWRLGRQLAGSLEGRLRPHPDAEAQRLAAESVSVRVVSMPSVEVFEQQDAEYREQVLPASTRKRLAVEAAHVDYWRKWVGLDGDVIGMASFGASAPGGDLFEHFGFTVEKVVAAVKGMNA